jgi:hypothetical protein
MPDHERNDAHKHEPDDSPAAWFVVLERAKRTNDFQLAAQAQRELERLGVRVTYTPTPTKAGKAVRRDR